MLSIPFARERVLRFQKWDPKAFLNVFSRDWELGLQRVAFCIQHEKHPNAPHTVEHAKHSEETTPWLIGLGHVGENKLGANFSGDQ